jgi:hypothetical protein
MKSKRGPDVASKNIISRLRGLFVQDKMIDGEPFFFVGWSEHKDVVKKLATTWRSKSHKVRIKPGKIVLGAFSRSSLRQIYPVWYVYASRKEKK